jgi:galactokinase/mevalonate kinase-like predicted kinase
MIQIIKDLASSWKIVGDGWGGYLLILCEKEKSSHIINELVKEFYMSNKNKVLLSDDVDQYIKVVSKPGNGLAILDPSSEIWY